MVGYSKTNINIRFESNGRTLIYLKLCLGLKAGANLFQSV